MQQRRTAISILFLTVIVSGCMGPGQSTQAVSGQAITVSGPTVQPSSAEIEEGSTVQVSLGIKNTGETNATLMVGEKGEEILTDYCPDVFDINNFNAYSSGTEETKGEYRLEPSWEASFNWELSANVDTGIIDDRCDLSFQAPFKYSVDAFRELQVKRNNEVGSAELSSKSSRGPIIVEIEAIGGTTDETATFIQGDNVEALVRFRKKTDNEGNPYQGLIDITNPQVSTAGNIRKNSDNCDIPSPIKMYDSTSQIIRCDILYGDNNANDNSQLSSPSMIGTISASADYTYTKNAGTKTITVVSRGR